MKSKYFSFKSEVIRLRKLGKTYGEIIKLIGKNIPKSTLSDWCNSIYLTSKQREKIDKVIKESSMKGLAVAHSINKARRKKYLESIVNRNKNLSLLLKNIDIAKIALSILYLGEGSKNISRGSLSFGNSDPFVIHMFLSLMRKCYNIDERKFRCTVQCRADQNTKFLEDFWSKITNIPQNQFYKTNIDKRTIGKKSKKTDYKGVCRIDYFSADLFLDLMYIPKVIHKGP